MIASRTLQGGDYIIEGWNGFYVPPHQPEALRERIAYLLEHPDEIACMGQNNRKLVEERYTLDVYTDRIKASINSVVGGAFIA